MCEVYVHSRFFILLTPVVLDEQHLLNVIHLQRLQPPETASRTAGAEISQVAGSTFQSSHHRCSCQSTLTHSAAHHLERECVCEATRCLLSCMSLVTDREQMFGSLCVSGQSQETQCEGQTQVGLRVKNRGHMIHPDQVFRTLWATCGYL